MLDNVSQCMNQLPVYITQYELESDCKEEWEIEFGD